MCFKLMKKIRYVHTLYQRFSTWETWEILNGKPNSQEAKVFKENAF